MNEPFVFDSEFVKWFSTLGVGGIIAALMFMYYRKDIKQYTELWRSTAEMLISVIKENTASNTKLISLIENMERNALRKSDVQVLIDRRLKNPEVSS